jgi:uncharacterized SAM-binding protein YcdF (DUF218 family)
VIRRTLLLLFVAYVVAASYLFVVHHDDPPAKADAVVVLSGTQERLPVGQRLVREGFAPLLVVSRATHPKASERKACRTGALCFRANPYSTRGEARAIANLAAKRGWRTVDVVTSQFHIFRARILIRRCYHGALRMVGAPEPAWRLPLDAVKETVKLTYQELVARSC